MVVEAIEFEFFVMKFCLRCAIYLVNLGEKRSSETEGRFSWFKSLEFE